MIDTLPPKGNVSFNWTATTDWLDWQFQPSDCGLVTSGWLSGALDEGHVLTQQLLLLVFQDPDEMVVNEPQTHIHGVGDSLDDAVEDFTRALVDTFEMLSADERELGHPVGIELRQIRSYLRSIPARS